ncbi:MAG: heme exporter protein CcmB [Sneathiella sp.]|jgi:heme exporter protein B|uniref:heme exporter protein CcmB n=1 Tax=Sneathiella sp. TaxID=1964365 RepID=UPI000C4EB096|nr:heme exporter protein CcmB [Sneathiella sp.]MAL78989.1 heme exporter protein CcmB [Sneathiella sp.]HBT31836.1 heme exporter protein CcmB [Pusillimonas sp.]
MNRFVKLVRRDLTLALRQGSAVTLSLSFFVMTVVLFPLGVGPELGVLARIGPGVLWVAALLACLLTLDRMFQADFEDGSLDLLLIGPLPVEMLVLAKVLAHWLTSILPLIIIAPVLGLSLNLPLDGIIALTLALLLGTPTLSLIGAVGAALTVAMRRGGVLLSLLVLPLYIPVLIFGVAAVEAAISMLPATPHLLLLGGISLGALVVGPLAAAAALRLSLS